MLEVMTTRRCAIGVPHRGITDKKVMKYILLEESKITDKPTTVPEIIHIIYETNCIYIYKLIHITYYIIHIILIFNPYYIYIILIHIIYIYFMYCG